jgi:hypothetical protein
LHLTSAHEVRHIIWSLFIYLHLQQLTQGQAARPLSKTHLHYIDFNIYIYIFDSRCFSLETSPFLVKYKEFCLV